MAGETEVLGENLPVPLCPAQIPHDLGSNPGRRSGKLATNRPSYDKALIVPIIGTLYFVTYFISIHG
jgi:hypothetical protein